MPEAIIALITALASQECENECLEFKHSNTNPNRIGRDISIIELCSIARAYVRS